MKKFNPDPDRTLIGSDTDPGKKIRIGIPAKNKNKIKSLLVGTGTYFLFSMVFVGSVFDTDPDSGSSPTFDTVRIRIRIKKNYTDPADPDQIWLLTLILNLSVGSRSDLDLFKYFRQPENLLFVVVKSYLSYSSPAVCFSVSDLNQRA